MLLVAVCLGLPATAQPVELEPFLDGLDRPLALLSAGDGSGRLFVVEQGGLVRVVRGGSLVAEPFLDLSNRVSCCGEQGLLGLAFHPDYEANGRFFASYTDSNGASVVSRFSISDDPDRADAGSEVELLSIPQPATNHNGGHLAFGPDGYLYVGVGDGGGAGDPQNNAQQLDTPLGKILRLDVDALPVAVPPDNPFVGSADSRPEIWAYGLRNPWRFSFDRATGDLWIADVGQDRREEVNLEPADDPGGANYGWRRLEGSLCFQPPSGCDPASTRLPVVEYGHASGCSVTGGFRYRGSALPQLVGTYVYGDFCSGRIWGATPAGDGSWTSGELLDTDLAIASFGEDARGELYVLDLGGRILRLASRELLADGFESGDTSAWNRTRGDVGVVSPGLGGTAHALDVPVDGPSERSFVLTRRPRRERSLRSRFLLDVRRVDLGESEVEVLRWVGRGGRHPVAVHLAQEGSRHWLALDLELPGQGVERLGRTRVRSNRAVEVEIVWTAASTADADDGTARLLVDGDVRLESVALANGTERVRAVQLGLPSGSPTGSGSFRLDEFVLNR